MLQGVQAKGCERSRIGVPEYPEDTAFLAQAVTIKVERLFHGVVPGGGTALVQIASGLDDLIAGLSGGAKDGAMVIQRALRAPLRCIAENCGVANPDEIVKRVAKSPAGTGFNGWTGELTDLKSAGIMDSVRSTCSALRNAGSIAGLILTTQALVTDKPEWDDPTYGAARGGGAERLEMGSTGTAAL